MSPLRAVLCDLDDTLFDHAGATRAALTTLYAIEPAFHAWTIDELDARHRVELDALLADVIGNRRSIVGAREERFRRLLAAAPLAAAANRASQLADAHRRAYESAWRPINGALEFAAALRSRGIALAIVTNSIVDEQRMKLARCGLTPFVDVLVTSEEVGVPKPGRDMFDLAMRRLGVTAPDVVMFGDAWATDIAGATAAGIRAVWFNPRGERRPSDDASVTDVAALTPLADLLAVLGVVGAPNR